LDRFFQGRRNGRVGVLDHMGGLLKRGMPKVSTVIGEGDFGKPGIRTRVGYTVAVMEKGAPMAFEVYRGVGKNPIVGKGGGARGRAGTGILFRGVKGILL